MTEYENRVGKPNAVADKGVVLPQAQNIRTHDHLGLSLDPADWAKSKCATCNGRGVFLNTRSVAASELVKGATGGSNLVKTTEPCGCALLAYRKVMEKLQARVLAVWNHPGVAEDKKLEGIVALLKEAHEQVRNAGKITDIKALVITAHTAATSKINKPTVDDIVRSNQARRR